MYSRNAHYLCVLPTIFVVSTTKYVRIERTRNICIKIGILGIVFNISCWLFPYAKAMPVRGVKV